VLVERVDCAGGVLLTKFACPTALTADVVELPAVITDALLVMLAAVADLILRELTVLLAAVADLRLLS